MKKTAERLLFSFIQRYFHQRLLYAEYLSRLGDVEVVKLLIELVYRGKLTLRKPRRADSGLGLAA